MRVVTLATHSDGYYDCLLQSCRRYNVKLEVLGWGTKWQGFNHKLHLLCKFLQNLPEKEVVMCIDAYDVVLLNDVQELEKQYNDFVDVNGSKMIVSTEKYANRLFKLYSKLAFGSCQGNDLNAGTYIGHAGTLLNVLRSVTNNDSFQLSGDDQRALTTVCKLSDDIAFDTEWDWFVVANRFADKSGIQISNQQLTYNNHQPFVLHCPGNVDMTPFLLQLGYEPTYTAENRTTFQYMCKVVPHQLAVIVQHNKTVVFLFVLFLVVVAVIMYRSRRCNINQ